MDRQRLFLIDGSALFYRSYFAFIRSPLFTSSGENTSAAFGVAHYLMKIIYDEKPDYLAVVFDTAVPTFRHQLYSQYKATREKMPEEMSAQYPRVLELVAAFNVPVIEAPNLPPDPEDGRQFSYEADDVIGTLARRAEKAGIETYMCTGDKDMWQILSPGIKVYSMRPGKDAEIFDVAAVERELGIKPSQVVDFLALMGDSSDNVPGVPKVGKKTALALLQEFGSVEGIYANLDKISRPSIRESLEASRDMLAVSRRLVTLNTSVPLEVKFDELRSRPPDREKLLDLFKVLEFRSLAERVVGGAEEDSPVSNRVSHYDPARQRYHLVNDAAALKELSSALAAQQFFVFDTETTGLDPFSSEVIGMSFCWEKGTAYYVPLYSPQAQIPAAEVTAALKPVFENPAIRKGGQNIKFDALMLSQHQIDVQGLAFDTMIAAYLISPGSRQNNLDALAEKYLHYKMIPIESLIGKKGKNQLSMRDVPLDEVCPYACEDADITFQLKSVLEKELKSTGTNSLFVDVEMPLVEVLLEMEKTGVKLDIDFLAEMSVQLGEEIEQVTAQLYETAGEQFNLNSPQQLGTILFDKLEIHRELGERRPRRTPTGQYSTSESVLLKYRRNPVVEKILDYRKLTKLKSTYVDALPRLISARTGRLHTSFNQTIAATGRLSSSDPNLQNIPIRGEKGREIRRAFVAEGNDRRILSADYSQVELRVLAHLCDDTALKEAFVRGEDIHSTTAAAIFAVSSAEVTPEFRRKAKEVNFGIIYGISRFGLASRLGISADEAEEIIQSYFARFPRVNAYMAATLAFARENNYVTTILNRRRYVPEIHSRNANIRQNAERIAINATIQGSAADLIKLAMINIHRKLSEGGMQTRMILQVHDELVFEVPTTEVEAVRKMVVHEMENAMKLNVPLKVDAGVGQNWLEAH